MFAELTSRDRRVLHLVSGLGQVATTHIRALLFSDRDRKTMDRSLKRLVRGSYLLKLGKRAPHELKGGNSPAVYQLGHEGWLYMEKRGKYTGRHEVGKHKLLVADLFVDIMTMEKAGLLRTLALEPEYANDNIISDLYIDVEIEAINRHRRYYVEVQRNSRSDVIPRKHRNYAAALKRYDPDSGGIWPYLIWMVYDPQHQRDIRRQVPEDMRSWVRVQTKEQFLAGLTTV